MILPSMAIDIAAVSPLRLSLRRRSGISVPRFRRGDPAKLALPDNGTHSVVWWRPPRR